MLPDVILALEEDLTNKEMNMALKKFKQASSPHDFVLEYLGPEHLADI